MPTAEERRAQHTEWVEGFRDRLSEAMRRSGLSQRALAKSLAVEESQVSRWMRETAPRTPTIQRIAKATSVPFDWLLGGMPTFTRPESPVKGADWHELPKVAFAAAGEPIHELPSDTAWYAFHRTWVERRAKGASHDDQRLVVVEVDKRQESMLPTIRPGAILVVDRGHRGDGVVTKAEDRKSVV